MTQPLRVGVAASATYTVDDDMAPPHLPVKVLSTPSMIMLIEGTCLAAVQSELGDTQTTVGVHVCVSHGAAAMSGEDVRVDTKLVIIDRRRLTFETTVTAGDRVLSTGTHARMVVDMERFG